MNAQAAPADSLYAHPALSFDEARHEATLAEARQWKQIFDTGKYDASVRRSGRVAFERDLYHCVLDRRSVDDDLYDLTTCAQEFQEAAEEEQESKAIKTTEATAKATV